MRTRQIRQPVGNRMQSVFPACSATSHIENMTDEAVRKRLLQLDIGDRFPEDIEFLNRVRHPEHTFEEVRIQREFLRRRGVCLRFLLAEAQTNDQ